MYHTNLEAWKESIELVTKIYKITKNFPEEEKFGLVNQMKRAAVSIPSNIAEGCARATDKDTMRFIDTALGSLAELDTQLIISEKLGFINYQDLSVDIDKIKALIMGLKNILTGKTNIII